MLIAQFTLQSWIPQKVKVEIEDKSYILTNIYAPNKDKDLVVFFRNILKVFRDGNIDCEENIIIGGDFNCPLNPLLDKKRRRHDT